jgi:hypothetical protein
MALVDPALAHSPLLYLELLHELGFHVAVVYSGSPRRTVVYVMWSIQDCVNQVRPGVPHFDLLPTLLAAHL